MTATAARGSSHPDMRLAECKDCRREVAAGHREDGTQFFTYPESWAEGQLERGGSRTDRCPEHRHAHRGHISGIAVAYIDLETVGEVLDRATPSGPLGALGPLPDAHRTADTDGVDLGNFGFGMNEDDIRRMLTSLADPRQRVLVVKAGTGTGKSTYMPYRLLDPPAGCFRLADLGPIVVTEPRVQATVGVATFVGEQMSGTGGVGPGYPVGYQVAGDRQHDASCQLIYVTDGTMINWLREGRLSSIGTVIVDEAHERSTNIDFIMGYLRRELARYPHLRVIITSATFDADFYQQYFGGPGAAGKIDVPAVKSIGYGWPLFPELDLAPADPALADAWTRMAPELSLTDGADDERLVTTAWPRYAPPLKTGEVAHPELHAGHVEDLHATTRALLALRFTTPLPANRWQKDMPVVLAEFVVRLVQGLDAADIFGDVLGFLPTRRGIEEACEVIRAGLPDVDVFALLSSLPLEQKEAALTARRMGDRRKIVVSTNLAETSLTVEGVRFVVDSGLIAQSHWDVNAAQGGITTKAHSQAGIKQRWGRVGRKSPGWVFPLYTKDQLLELDEDTAPGSTRSNLESLVMTAKLGGISSVTEFPWPAAFLPEPPVVLEQAALGARDVFLSELSRADHALRAGGALDTDGDPTGFGKELTRLQVLGSASAAIAVMYADRLACVPEVATILALLNETRLTAANGLLLDDPRWPDEWRYEAAERHRALASACQDDAELVLQITAGWERADPETPPWEPSHRRRAWAHRWWVDHDTLLAAANTRRDILASLSPAMKEEVKRFVEPALLRRARGAISRAFASLEHRFDGHTYTAANPDGAERGEPAAVHANHMTRLPAQAIPLFRSRHKNTTYLTNLVTFESWATDGSGQASTGPADAVRLLVLSAWHGRPETHRDILGAVLEAWPAGSRAQIRLGRDAIGRTIAADVLARHDPAPLPDLADEEATPVDGDAATPTDSAPELDTRWPTGRPPVEDTEALARRAVLDHRQVEADEAACGTCSPCLTGDVDRCEYPWTVETGGAMDALAFWRTRATAVTDVSAPLIFSVDGQFADDAWYEVVGYHVDEDTGEPAVMVRPDWRSPDDTNGPGAHPDLSPGAHVDVIVGSTLRDHHSDLRILTRADGKGRFLLREAAAATDRQDENAQLAISLHRRHTGQLARLHPSAPLTVTAIPGVHADQFTVTLLDLLHQHLADSAPDLLSTALPDGRTISLPFAAAVVTEAANSAGYVTAELLARDTGPGLVHTVAYHGGDVPPHPGTPVLVRLNRERARLPLRGRPLAPVADVVRSHDDIRLATTKPGTPTSEPPAALPPTGTSSARLEATRPLSRTSAAALADLALDETWVRDVWLFWARSRHRSTDRHEPTRPGTATDPVNVPAVARPELPAEVRMSVVELQARHPVGTRLTAIVTSVSDAHQRAWLRLPDGVPATVAAKDVDTGNDDLTAVLRDGDLVEGVVAGHREQREAGQLVLRLRDAPRTPAEPPATPSLHDAVARYPRGAALHGVVERVRNDLGRAWVRLPDGLQASVAAADVGLAGVLQLDHVLTTGMVITGTSRGVSERNGVPQVQAELRELPTPSIWEQLDVAGVQSGAVLDGQVRNAVETLGVFVDVLPGAQGLVPLRELAGRMPSTFTRGSRIRVRVTAIGEDRKKPGRPAIHLALA